MSGGLENSVIFKEDQDILNVIYMFKSSRSVGYFATGTKITSAVAREESCLQDKLTGLLITKSDLLQH